MDDAKMQYIQQGDKEQEGDASIIAMFLTAEQCAVGKQRSCYMEHNHFCVTHTHSWSCNMGLHVLGMATAVALFFHWSLVSQDHANASCSHKLDNSCPHTHTHLPVRATKHTLLFCCRLWPGWHFCTDRKDGGVERVCKGHQCRSKLRPVLLMRLKGSCRLSMSYDSKGMLIYARTPYTKTLHVHSIMILRCTVHSMQLYSTTCTV